MAKNDKKLELSWYNKDKSLYYDPDEKEYLWVDKKDPRVSEPRIFLEKAAYGDKDAENMLIRGDNLLALKALLQDFRNKIKLIYIDPPFNTGSAFEYYDDGLEHSIWLTMIRDRLELLKKLDGFENGKFELTKKRDVTGQKDSLLPSRPIWLAMTISAIRNSR